MTLLKDIKEQNWSLSIDTQGVVVEGDDDIAQCLFIILTTVPGTDRLRPDFGCGIFEFLDKPVGSSVANMAKSIQDAVTKWEPRVAIAKIIHNFDAQGNVSFDIYWKTAAAAALRKTTLNYGN